MSLFRKGMLGLITVFALVIGLASIARYFIFDPVSGNQILIEQGLNMYEMTYKPWNYALYLHIITAAIAIMIGPFQFMQNKKNPRRIAMHRNLGKLYVASIMVSGVVGVYLSFYAFGGLVSKSGFFVLSVSWIITTYLAYYYIRIRKNVKLHKEWIYRSYALTLVAISFRFWSAVIGYSLDDFAVGYISAIWLGLIGNIIGAELWIRKRRVSKS